MESRTFIKQAAILIEKIESAATTITTRDDSQAVRDGLQKEISSLFTGLYNPTLPSAYRLRDVALRNGYSVAQPVLQRLAQLEYLS